MMEMFCVVCHGWFGFASLRNRCCLPVVLVDSFLPVICLLLLVLPLSDTPITSPLNKNATGRKKQFHEGGVEKAFFLMNWL